MRLLVKPLVAALVALVLVGGSAAPSGATVGTATSGTASLDVPPFWWFGPLAPTAGWPCSGLASAQMNIDMLVPTAGSAQIWISSPLNIGSGNVVFLDLWSSTGSASIAPGSPQTMTVGPFHSLGGSATLTTETSPGSCVRSTTTCSAFFNFTLSGSWTGSVTVPTLTGSAYLFGSTTISTSGCPPALAGLNGRTLMITAMDITF